MDNFNIQPNTQAKHFFSMPKIVFIIFGIILLAEIVYAFKTLNVPTPPPPVPAPTSVSQQTSARISLNTAKTDYKVKEAVPVSVLVDTGSKEISGVDLIIQYDPKVLEATAGGLVKGGIMDEYPLVSVDAKKGVISISGVSNLSNGFAGQGEFAAINFKAKAAGKTSLIINLDKGSTTASNLVEAATVKNILDTVGNLDIYVQ